MADDVIPTIETLMAREPRPDHILIEAYGLALADADAVADRRFAPNPAAVEAQRLADDSLDRNRPFARPPGPTSPSPRGDEACARRSIEKWRTRTVDCLDDEARTAMTLLLKQSHSQSAVARMPGVSERTVRYHRQRQERCAVDGRARQDSAATAHASVIEHLRNQQANGCILVVALHDCPSGEHSSYAGSLKAAQH